MRIKKFFLIICSSLFLLAALPLTVLSDENSDAENIDTNSTSGDYSTKDEVIYGNLQANGQIKNMYVVNSFDVTKPGEILDYGKYTDLRNLTDLSDIEQTGSDEVHFQAEGEEFYYQGEIENHPLPWDFSISYFLDGEEINSDELAGQSGDLEIHITTSANKNVDPLFSENYLLQISLTLDPSIFHDIQAPKGTEANEGKNKLMNFTVMPGQEEVLILSAQVLDLKMDPIEISAIPANIAIEDPDIGNMTDDMKTLSDAISEINSGAAELNNGISELNNGATKLSNGSGEYRDGINEIDQSSEELVNGSQEILTILQQISKSMQESPNMPDLDDLDELPEGFREMASGLQESAEGLDTLKENYDELYKGLGEIMAMFPSDNIDEEIYELYTVLEKNKTDASVRETVDQLVSTYHTALAAKQAYSKMEKGFGIISETLEQIPSGLKKMANSLEAMADGIEYAMKDLGELDALAELQDGLATLSSEYASFHDGLNSYTKGVGLLASSYSELDKGTEELSSGISALYDGASQLHEGTKKLHESTNTLPDQIESELDEFMEEYDFSNFEPISFVSSQNKNIGVVQFVLKTESIEIEEPETITDQEEQNKSFWDRFIDLFR